MKKIDFVVPWVDNSDPIWQAAFKKHKGDEALFTDASDKRYRDWGLFKYWFRGVEKYAPWVNRIHLITCGHYPKWLNLKHPKLNFVKHEDYIPEKYLPTFSSHPIELNMHRIKDLTEHFVYFNDDFYLINDCEPKDFFKNNLPNDSAILDAYDGMGFSKTQINNIAIINKNFSKKEVVRTSKWFNFKYGKAIWRTFALMPWNKFTGIYDFHLANSFLKSTFEEVWQKEFEALDRASANKFRNLEQDVSQYLFRFWQIASGSFNPIAKQKLGDYCPIGLWDLNKIIKIFINSKKPIIVLNDHDPVDLDKTITELKKIFESKFPEKSSFEL